MRLCDVRIVGEEVQWCVCVQVRVCVRACGGSEHVEEVCGGQVCCGLA